MLGDVEISLHSTPEDFGAVVRAVYDRDPVLFTLELTTLRARNWPASSVLLSVRDRDAEGAAVQSADGVLLVSGLHPDWAHEVMSTLSENLRPVTGVRGTPVVAAACAAAWAAVTGGPTVIADREALYRLATLKAPTGVDGRWRSADAGDTDLLVDWLGQFFAEAFATRPDGDAHRAFLHQLFASDDKMLLWAVGDVPVSMARLHAPADGVSRIGPVFTPPEYRSHGYAAAVTACAVHRGHECGANDVVLFADLANQTSNRVYQRLGFEVYDEHVRYAQG